MNTVLERLQEIGDRRERSRASAVVQTCGIVSNELVAEDACRLVFHSAVLAGTGMPGQFVHVNCGMILRRPFSISGIDRSREVVDITYRLVGPGTDWLSHLRQGDDLNVIGPLGNGFSNPSRPGAALLVAGGIGVAPLLALAKELSTSGRRLFALVGARSSGHLIGLDLLEELGVSVTACTDDGSTGFKGTVCDMLYPTLKRCAPAKVYSCGPLPVLRAVGRATEELQIPCEISVEDRLACGIGACVGCAVRRRVPQGESVYFRACCDGPVFESRDIVL